MVDLEHSELFLRQLGRREPGAPHVVIWDGAGFHPQAGKDHLCNRVFASLRAVQTALTKFLRPFWEDPARVRDLDRLRLVAGASPGLFPSDLHLFDRINGITLHVAVP